MATEVNISHILEQSKSKFSIEVSKTDDLEYDLGSLCAYDTHPFDAELLKGVPRDVAIKTVARDNIQLLVNRVWALPVRVEADGVFVHLPEATTEVPRAMPAPKPKPETKWQKFAKEKGIKKKRKDKMVYDAESGEWKRRYGYGGMNDDSQEWAIEAKATDVADGTDPWMHREKEKKERISKQKQREVANITSANKRAAKTAGSVPILPASLALSAQISDPVERGLHGSEAPTYTDKRHLKRAFDVAKFSTGSLGREDRMVDGETKEIRQRGKRHKHEALLGDTKKEREHHVKVVERILGPDQPSINVDKAVSMYNAKQVQEGKGKRGRGGRGGKSDGNKRKR
eukprot:TRINITY_DN15212_c0_g1_i1.p1 TRINITY_DN15212_c0_g1~~TRINITY_DN15212_c0_g1_i1.p1  ORF type:complete len:359 (+),score=65.37 TRINITY_DN15212_c0_g1_i1:49-1077(+)